MVCGCAVGLGDGVGDAARVATGARVRLGVGVKVIVTVGFAEGLGVADVVGDVLGGVEVSDGVSLGIRAGSDSLRLDVFPVGPSSAATTATPAPVPTVSTKPIPSRAVRLNCGRRIVEG